MLRVLEHGLKVKMILTDSDTYSVDTPEDIQRVAHIMKDDELTLKYRF
jgi:3-deoxy-manno-octulosonate cytidylyltransferase (CMP-KDO synthetase)